MCAADCIICPCSWSPSAVQALARPRAPRTSSASVVRAAHAYAFAAGMDVRGMPLDQVAPLIRGQIGTMVTLAILRPGASETVPVSLTRQAANKVTGTTFFSPAKAGGEAGGDNGLGGITLDEAFPKQTLEKLRQLRVTLEQERIAVAKEREQSAKLQAALEDQIEKLEGRCKQLLAALESVDGGEEAARAAGLRS